MTSYSPAYVRHPAPTAPIPSSVLPIEVIVSRVPDIKRRLQARAPDTLDPMSDAPSSLKERLRSDLTEAIKERDKVRSGTIRMVLTAITEAEVAGSEAIELSDQQVLDVVIREAKKRREAEEAYANAGRTELAKKEHAESEVLADYLPQQLSQDEIAALVADAIASTGAAALGMKGMGKVMGQVTPLTKGRADGSVIAAEVRRQLAG